MNTDLKYQTLLMSLAKSGVNAALVNGKWEINLKGTLDSIECRFTEDEICDLFGVPLLHMPNGYQFNKRLDWLQPEWSIADFTRAGWKFKQLTDAHIVVKSECDTCCGFGKIYSAGVSFRCPATDCQFVTWPKLYRFHATIRDDGGLYTWEEWQQKQQDATNRVRADYGLPPLLFAHDPAADLKSEMFQKNWGLGVSSDGKRVFFQGGRDPKGPVAWHEMTPLIGSLLDALEAAIVPASPAKVD